MPLTTRPASTSKQAMIRFVSVSEGTEILQNLQSGRAGFFRMKLHAENVLPFHSRGKSSSIFGGSHCAFYDRSAVGVRVIHEGASWNAPQQTRVAAEVDPVPSDMRRLYQSREAGALAGKQSGSRRFRRLRAPL